MQSNSEIPLEELCARIIGMARDFAEDFPTSDVAVDVLERNSLRRTLEGFAQHGGLSRRDDIELDILAAVLNRETRGWIQSFEGIADPENGAVGYDIEIRDLTERGRRVERLLKQLNRSAHLRSTGRARLDAVKLIMGR